MTRLLPSPPAEVVPGPGGKERAAEAEADSRRKAFKRFNVGFRVYIGFRV